MRVLALASITLQVAPPSDDAALAMQIILAIILVSAFVAIVEYISRG